MVSGTRKNQRPQECTDCGAIVEAGNGSLWWEADPDDGGDVVGRAPAGWRVTHFDRSECDRIRADRAATKAAAKAAREVDIAAKQAAERAAIENQERQVKELLASVPACTNSGYNWSEAGVLDPNFARRISFVSLNVDENPALAGLSLGHSDWAERRTLDGRTCYVHAFGNARVLHAPREVIEAAWTAFAKEFARTSEQAEANLAKFGPEAPSRVEARARKARGENVASWDMSPCAGWELDAFVAGRVDLIAKYGGR